MFCPQCATPNADGVKFCRSCGQELEALSLVLAGGQATPARRPAQDERVKWLTKQVKAVKGITAGLILMTVSLLIGCALALFTPADVSWIFIWLVFFGWMACWGGIEVANGVGGLIESKGRLRVLDLAGEGHAGGPAPRRLSPADEPPAGASPFAGRRPTATPASVTEGTTRHLDDRVEK